MLSRYRELAKDLWQRPCEPRDPDLHLQEAVGWLYRAQDARADGGVSHSYGLGRGWLPSYPETTGYIIPTLLCWWKRSGDPEARERALRMADWELSVQYSNGSIPALAAGKPAVFDTGQVLFGWVSAYLATGDERYFRAALRAGNWLVDILGPDVHSPRRPGSHGVVYNSRTAWALCELAAVDDSGGYAEAAHRFLEWTLTQEETAGWFGKNCLNDVERPLLHTIAYTAQGQLEGGLKLKDRRFREAAERTARALQSRVAENGWMAGRFDRSWSPSARWACLTGMAQMSIIWWRLAALTQDDSYHVSAERVRRFLLSVHDVASKNGGLRGGVRGSYPVNGEYCRWRVPNWATKFLVDALLFPTMSAEEEIFPG